MARMQNKDKEIDKKIGQKLLELRLAKGLSRQQLSEVIGVTHQQLSKYEQGTNRISVSMLIRLSESLRVEPLYFLSDFSFQQEEVLDNYRIRMNLEVIRHLDNIGDEAMQNAILELIKVIARQFKS